MTVRSHIAEVLRQGVWASLTGGWFYDPRQSLFCNTLHLYLWMILLLFPLILGLSAGTSLSFTLIGIYSLTIGAIFSVIKGAVWYLHKLFDTHDPLLAQESRTQSRQSLPTDPLKTEGTSGDERAGAIEMVTLRRSQDTGGPMTSSAPGFLNLGEDQPEASTETEQSTRNDVVPLGEKSELSADLAVAADVHIFPDSGSETEYGDSMSRGERSPSSDQKLLRGSGDSESGRGEEQGLKDPSKDHQDNGFSPDDTQAESGFRRKLSEPNFSARRRESFRNASDFRKKRVRRSSGESQNGVRRVQSSLETNQRDVSSSLLLSQRTLEQCKLQGTRKSYPSKTSSTDIFLMQARPPREELIATGEGAKISHVTFTEPSTSGNEREEDISFRSTREYPNDSDDIIKLPDAIMETEDENLPSQSFAVTSTPKARTSSVISAEEEEGETSKFSTLRSEASKAGTTSFYTAGSRSSSATVTSGTDKSGGSDSSQLSSARPDSPRRDRFLRNLRLKLDAIRSESTGALTEEAVHRQGISSRSSTPDLTWLFDEEEPSDCGKDVLEEPQTPSTSRNSVAIEPQVIFAGKTRLSRQSPRSAASGEPLELYVREESGSGRGKRRLELVPREKRDEPRPSTSGAADIANLKEELKILLEEIIETHPEALEAIESVRQSRLGLSGSQREGSDRLDLDTPRGEMKPEQDLSELPKASPSISNAERASEMRRRRSTGGRRRERHAAGSSGRSGSAGLIALADMAQKSGGTHVATSHEDTADGAVHCFQDEDGTWWTYTFDSDGVGTAQALGSSRAVMEMISAQSRPTKSLALEPLPDTGEEDQDLERGNGRRKAKRRGSSSSSDDDYLAEVPSSVLHPVSASQMSREIPFGAFSSSFGFGSGRRSVSRRSTNRSNGSGNELSRMQWMVERTMAQGIPTTPGEFSNVSSHYPAVSGSVHTSSLGSGSSLNRIRFLTGMTMGTAGGGDDYRASFRKKYFYRLSLFPKLWPNRTWKLKMDRLKLLALFDRNRTAGSAIFDTALAITVGVLACFLLKIGLFTDLRLLLFSLVVAGAQFSVMKSVQPDASSPVHGYNWMVTYSRPVYFCLCASIILLLHFCQHNLHGYSVPSLILLEKTRDFFVVFLLFLPLLFTLGLLPQVNTFGMHVLEQLDMHLLGGTASFSFLSAAYGLGKSLLCAGILFSAALAAFRLDPPTQNILFSLYCSLSVCLSYVLSRSSSSPTLLWCLMCEKWSGQSVSKSLTELSDPLPNLLRETVSVRLKHDLLVTGILGLVAFGLHTSTVFTKLEGVLTLVLIGLSGLVGFLNHYLWPQLRKQTPWLLVGQPVLKSYEHGLFETWYMARLMWFERSFAGLCFLERNLLYPFLVLSSCTEFGSSMVMDFGTWGAALILAVFALKILRGAYCNSWLIYWPLLVSVVVLRVDFMKERWSWFPLVFYVSAVMWPKLRELMLKLEFIFAYVAPWQISWGSAFHAFAQPFAVPHSALTLAQATVSSLVSAPLNPFLGSSFFLTSYMRPVKFWEKDYNTRRVDHSNTRLITHIDRGPMTDDSNLNAIFYEHLTRSLQQSLAGDLALGRWSSTVSPGDCFILASYYLNCLVHIVEVGNGFVTFQLRGLEFRGTYCQQREVEAISEDIAEGEGCCCCEPGRLPGFLSFNTAWTLRWLAWEVTAAKYVVEGYSITDNSAVSMLQVHELRRLLVTLYVKCIIYYTLMSAKLEEWLCMEGVVSALEPVTQNPKYVDVDPMFSLSNDEDYDMRLSGVSRQSFCQVYLDWVAHCAERRSTTGHGPVRGAETGDSLILALCYSLGLVGRRTLGAAAHNRHSSAAESFLYGLHALFKGDFRITSSRDEWVFTDMDLLRCVIAPAVRMALKLHQDHFTAPDDFEESSALFERITSHESNLFISHEHDPAWRQAILANTPSLLALRHVFDDGQDDFKVIMLNRRHLSFRVIKLNKECVRAFWSGQQQELIFLRNRNPERGSIQNARQVLRNMINSSADQPIGYPIYVSPLTTSFVETHVQVSKVLGPPFTLDLIRRGGRNLWRWLRNHCGTSGSSNLSLPQLHLQNLTSYRQSTDEGRLAAPRAMDSAAARVETARDGQRDSLERSSEIPHGSWTLPPESGGGPALMQRSFTHPLRSAEASGRSNVLSLAGRHSHRSSAAQTTRPPLPARHRPTVVISTQEGTADWRRPSSELKTQVSLGVHAEVSSSSGSRIQRVKIEDPSQIFETLNHRLVATGQPVVSWPNEKWMKHGGKSGWESWRPEKGMEASLVHRWTPSNPDSSRRSHIGQTILLLQVDADRFVPIGEAGVSVIGDEV